MSDIKTALILGASSGIGRALSETIAVRGWNLVLCSRGEKDLEATSANIRLRYKNSVQYFSIDIIKEDERDKLISFISKEKKIRDIFITIGDINEIDDGLQDRLTIDRLVYSNYLSIVHFLSGIMQSETGKEYLNVILLSSIAITRPRKNNLVYSASKSAVDFYCRGLQHLFAGTNVKIIVFRLGYIDTIMTYGRKLYLPPASAKKAAVFIFSRINKSKRVCYYPVYWRYISFIIKLVPWGLYKRLSF